MKTKAITKTIFVFLCLSFFTVLQADTVLNGGGFLYGEKTGYLIQAPPDWVFDNSSGVKDGLYCVMYPNGSTWQNFRVLIYARIFPLNGTNLEDYISKNIELMKSMSPGLTWKKVKKTHVNRRHPAIIMDYDGFSDGAIERTAYVEYKDYVLMLVMTSKHRKLMKKHKKAIEAVLKNLQCLDVGGKK